MFAKFTVSKLNKMSTDDPLSVVLVGLAFGPFQRKTISSTYGKEDWNRLVDWFEDSAATIGRAREITQGRLGKANFDVHSFSCLQNYFSLGRTVKWFGKSFSRRIIFD